VSVDRAALGARAVSVGRAVLAAQAVSVDRAVLGAWVAQVVSADRAVLGAQVVSADRAVLGAQVVSVDRAVSGAWAVSADRAVPAERPGLVAQRARHSVRQAALNATVARSVQAARSEAWAAGGKPGSTDSVVRRADRLAAAGAQAALVAAVGPAAEHAVVAAVVAAEAGVRRSSMRMPASWPCSIVVAALWLGVAQAAPATAPEPQRSFASAEDAVRAFVTALRDHQDADLGAILGPEADRVIHSGDKYADQELQQRFVALYDQKHAIVQSSPGRAELDVGPDDWPLPIPVIESNGRWTFDTKAGAQTIIDRRIGRNELSAIRTLLAAVDAQRDFFQRAKQADGTGVYATRFISTAGKQDGLYWPVAEGETESPLGPLIDAAQDAGYPGDLVGGKPIPYEGYHFRILKAQGPNADGGAKSYLQSGRLTGGFAMIAWPAVFGSSGIVTFIVGPDGDVYQQDLGSRTGRIAAAMTTFDPDLSWSRVIESND
jgi:Protein of unknown function (DUF2950)